MRRTTFRAPSFSNHRLTVSPLNSRPSSFSRSDTCSFVNARFSEFVARSAAAFVGVRIDGRPLKACLRDLAPGCPLSVLCSFSIALWGIWGQHRTTRRGGRQRPWGASFCQAEWLALFRRPRHNGGPQITRRPACHAGECLRSPSWLCHGGGAVNGLKFKNSPKQFSKKIPKYFSTYRQNRGLLTRTFSTIRTRIFFFVVSISVTVSFQRT